MSSPYVSQPGVAPPPVGPYMPLPGPPGGPVPPQPSSPRKRGLLVASGLAMAILLATVALVVGIIAISRPTTSPNRDTSSSTPTTSASTDTTAADRKLCEAIAPLIRENADTGKNFVNLGPSGTPARDAGIPDYQASVSDWVKRIQPIVDQSPYVDPFFTRTLQRFIDDTRIYASSIRPGPENDADAAAWNDKLVAIGGPFDVCHKLGVQW